MNNQSSNLQQKAKHFILHPHGIIYITKFISINIFICINKLTMLKNQEYTLKPFNQHNRFWDLKPLSLLASGLNPQPFLLTHKMKSNKFLISLIPKFTHLKTEIFTKQSAHCIIIIYSYNPYLSAYHTILKRSKLLTSPFLFRTN